MGRPRTSHLVPIAILTLAVIGAQAFMVAYQAVPVQAAGTSNAWPMDGHDAQHTSDSPFAGPSNGNVSWVQGVTDLFSSSVAVGNGGTVFAVGNETLYAFNSDGSFAWSRHVSKPAGGPALGLGGEVLVPQLRSVAAFAQDGTLEWNTTLGGPNLNTGLTVTPNGLVYSVNSGTLYALAPSGSILWQLSVACSLAPVTVGLDGTLYCGGRNNNIGAANTGVLFAIDPIGGILWKYFTPSPIDTYPLVAKNGIIYVSDDAGDFFAINSTGVPAGPAWTNGISMGFQVRALALATNGDVYVGGTRLRLVTPGGAVSSDLSCYNDPSKGVCVPFGKIGGITVDVSGVPYVQALTGNSSTVLAMGPSGSSLWTFHLPAGEVVTDAAAIGSGGSLYFGTSCLTCTNGDLGRLYSVGLAGSSAQVLVSETNIPAGQHWNLTLGGREFVADTRGFQVSVPANANYPWSTTTAYAPGSETRYVPDIASGVLSVGSSGTMALAFGAQYYVQFSPFPYGAGNISLNPGWFVAGSSIPLAAQASSGFRFNHWSSSSGGISLPSPGVESSQAVVNGPGTITGTFYPRVTVTASSGGSLSVSFPGNETTVAPGSSVSFYVPVSQDLLITATASQNFALAQWLTTPETTGYGNLSVIIFPAPSVPSQVEGVFAPQVAVLTTTTIQSSTATSATSSSTSAPTSSAGGLGLGLHLSWYDAAAGAVAVIVILAGFAILRRRQKAAA